MADGSADLATGAHIMQVMEALDAVVDRGRGKLALNDDRKKQNSKRPSGGEAGDKGADRNVGHALRSVYATAVSEEIPPELLDLLGKLK